MKKTSNPVTTSSSVKEQSLPASQEKKLMPPYFRYNVPAERLQIDALINEANKKFSGKGKALVTETTLTGGAKATGLPTIIPNGVVAVGWNCPTEFRANCSTGQSFTKYTWWFELGPHIYYLTRNMEGRVYFGIDGQSYSQAVQAGSGTAQLRVICDVSPRKEEDYTVYFDPVTLNFSTQTPCVELQSASFPDEQVPCEIVGDNHGARPKIKVNLTAPAGPSGQTVILILDDPHSPTVGRWLNGDSFVIPFGQTSGEWEGFLGTRKVLSTKTMSIRARVNGKESQPLTIKVKRN